MAKNISFFLTAWVLSACSLASVLPTTTPPSLNENVETVERYDVYELTIEHVDAPYTNPWEQVSLDATFTSPDGSSHAVDGFYYGSGLWKARFAPMKEGQWSWVMTLTTPADRITQSGDFLVLPSERPGFVRRHPSNPYRLVFEDGSLFNAIGIGDCIQDVDGDGNPLNNWGFDGDFRADHDSGSFVDMSTYMKAYGASGAGFNLFRWSVDNCSFKPWETISTEGNRYAVQAGIWGDRLLDALRQNGFRVWMTLFASHIPYPNAHNRPDQLEAIKRYFRYVVARYGAYVDVWELANEARLPDEWVATTAAALRAMDPYDHLITVSWEKPSLSEIDINAPHWYGREDELESDLVTTQKIQRAQKWGKPVVFGEQGNTRQNWDERSAIRMRLRSWTAFFEGGALIFWNTSFAKDNRGGAANLYIGPQERSYIRVLQDFSALADAEVSPFDLESQNPHVRAYGLRSPRVVLGYFHHFSDHQTPERTTITLDLPIGGVLTWLDPASGEVLDAYSVPSGIQTLSSMEFVIDLALWIQLLP